MLYERIRSDSIAARKAALGKTEDTQESVRAKSLTTLISKLQSTSKDAGGKELSDVEVVAVVKKSIAIAQDAIKEGATGAYAAKLQTEAAILNAYLPQQLDAEAIRTEVRAYAESKETPLEIKDTGVIMKALNTKFPGQINGSLVSEIIKAEVEAAKG